MEWYIYGIIVFALFWILLAGGLPVAFSLGTTAMVMMYVFWGFDGLLNIAMITYTRNANFLLIAIPLFIFMGECIALSGIGSDAFRMINAWFGRVPGGIAITTIGAGTIFGAVTGFSPATISALGPAVIPEMITRKYDKGFAVGSLVAASGLAIMIPPSILMVIYGYLAEISVGRLFYSGVMPGLILASVFVLYIVIRGTLNPNIAPPDHTKISFKEKIKVSVFILPFIGLIVLIMGSIWGGIASPSEAAALGALGSILLLICYKKFSREVLKELLYASVRVTCMVMFILVGGTLFTQVLVEIGFASGLGKFVVGLPVSRWIIFASMQLLVLILGCMIDAASLTFILIPIFLPILKGLGFDLYWFGITFMVSLEIAAMTPPVGLALYVVKGVSPEEVTMQDIIRGSAPYYLLYLVGMLPVVLFPEIISWLPDMIMG